MEFLKKKSDAVQNVKYYLTQLISHDRKPKSICINHGKEFLNENLMAWCHDKGITIQNTAPYSPSQNSVAKRMNQTPVEIAQAMIHGSPEFLWEYVINHSSYLHNQAYTKSLKNQTPYEKWFKKKPNISHLQ